MVGGFESEQQDVMAQFILSQGFNSVEVEVDKLEMCRRNGLYARLGDGDINNLLKTAAGLKERTTQALIAEVRATPNSSA